MPPQNTRLLKNPCCLRKRSFKKMISHASSHINLEKLSECQLIIGYTFHNVEILEKALTHTSCRLENNFSNERLEFLGDAVLGMIISDYLYKMMPHYSEGEVTNVKSVV